MYVIEKKTWNVRQSVRKITTQRSTLLLHRSVISYDLIFNLITQQAFW